MDKLAILDGGCKSTSSGKDQIIYMCVCAHPRVCIYMCMHEDTSICMFIPTLNDRLEDCG